MKTYLADANIFLRYFLDDVPVQAAKAKQFLKEAKEQKISLVVCPLMLFETYFVLAGGYGFTRDKITDFLGKIVGTPFIEVEEREIFSQVLIIFGKTKIDFVDCYLLARANSSKMEVLSFDKDFKKQKMLF